MQKTIVTVILLSAAVVLNSVSITLDESIEIAEENNKELLAEKNSVQAAEWGRYNAFSNFLPRANLNTSVVRIDDDTYQQAQEMVKIPVFGPDDMPTGDYVPFSAGAMMNGVHKTTYRNSITVQQPVFTGGKILLGYQLASLASQRAKNVVENKKNELSFQVTSTYLNILKLQELRELSENSLRSTTAKLQQVKDKYDAGLAKRSDVLQWQVKLQNDRTAFNEIDSNLQIVLSMWKNLLGTDQLYYPEKINVTDWQEEMEFFADLKGDEKDSYLDEVLAKVEKFNPTLKMLDVNESMMQKNYTMKKGNFLPSINLQFTYEIEDDDKLDFSGRDSWNLAAIVSLPLFSGGSNYTELKQAQHELRQTRYNIEYARENLFVGAKQAILALTNKAEEIDNNRKALEFAQENHQIINSLFDQDMVTNVELMDAEVMMFSSQMNLTASYYDFIEGLYELYKFTNNQEDR
jgi:outer membrane protein TolC